METTSRLLNQTTATPKPKTTTTRLLNQTNKAPKPVPTTSSLLDRTTATPKPAPTTTSVDVPSGPTHGIYIAYQTVYQNIPVGNGLPPQTATQYFDEIWSGQWENSAPQPPNYCDNLDASANEFGSPRTNSPPYPTTTITAIPMGTGNPKPTCDWMPDENTNGPGYLSCDRDPTSVSCAVAQAGATNCYAEDLWITPVIQCVWQEDQ